METIKFETLEGWIQRTGMCLEEGAEYLREAVPVEPGAEKDAAQRAALERLMTKMETRVIKALQLKDALSGSEFLREIGSWDWPFPSVERRFYEHLFSRMSEN